MNVLCRAMGTMQNQAHLRGGRAMAAKAGPGALADLAAHAHTPRPKSKRCQLAPKAGRAMKTYCSQATLPSSKHQPRHCHCQAGQLHNVFVVLFLWSRQ